MATSMRITTPQIRDRIDATYYHPKFVANELRLKMSGIPIGALNELVEKGRRAIYFQTSTMEKDEAAMDWIPFLTADDLGKEGIFIDLDARRRVSPKFADRYPNGLLRQNELLVKVKGPNQTTAYVEDIPDSKVLVSGTIWGGIVRTDKIDPWYLVTALSSEYGAVARTRLRTNLNVEFLSPEDLLRLELPVPDSLVQTYIGDKVQQAKRLWARARELEEESLAIFDEAIDWANRDSARVLSTRVVPNRLGPRLDMNFNSPKKYKLFDHFGLNKIKADRLDELVDISAMIGWKGLTTEHYVDEGPWLLRGVEYDRGIIDFESLVSVERYKYDEQPQIHLRPGDLALTKDGTLGKAICIPELNNEMAAGSTVARLRIKDDSIDPYYLEFALNHEVLQIQIESYATGLAQPHITQEWIAQLLIPRVVNEKKIGRIVRQHHNSSLASKFLVAAAKLLVEAMIEGKISENNLIAAQKTLESGDRTEDREILSRLTAKGIEIPGEPPLFPNLEGLYEALDALEGSEDN